MLTVERLRQLLHYDPATGVFTRRVSRGCTRAGARAGHAHYAKQYIRIIVDKRKYFAHRLAWLYVHGRWPADQINHINRVTTDNRIANLREADCSSNNHNRAPVLTGHLPGCTFCKRSQKWRAQIKHKRRGYALGYFDSQQAAHAAYVSAKRRVTQGITT